MRLLLIRHGQTPSNVVGALDTARPGADLTDLGRRQAAALPAALAGEPISAVYASPLVRTQQTAAPLAAALGLSVEVIEGIEEISAGDLEMASDSTAIETYVGTVAAWVLGDLDRVIPGGSSGHDFLARYDAALTAIAAAHGPDATVAVVSHGAAIRGYALLRAGADRVAEFGTLRVHNTGLVALDGSPATGWRVALWRTEPLGGAGLDRDTGHDVTGDSALQPPSP